MSSEQDQPRREHWAEVPKSPTANRRKCQSAYGRSILELSKRFFAPRIAM